MPDTNRHNVSMVHHYIDVSGQKIHLVDAGEGPVVILCHGFPEFWMSWRHQILSLVAAGYRVLALDMRGHGESSIPDDVDSYSVVHTVGDVIAIMDQLGIARAAIVGHDAGTTTAYHAALMRPDRITGVFGLSVPYIPRGNHSLIEALRNAAPPGFYMLYFQEAGIAEADLERDVPETFRRIFYANSGCYADAPITMVASADTGLIANLPQAAGELNFITDAEIDKYVAQYSGTGFRGGLNGYRVFDLNWRITAPWAGVKLPVPNAYIGGELDTVLTFPGFREAAMQMDQADFLPGTGHWIQSERPEAVNAALLRFLNKLDMG